MPEENGGPLTPVVFHALLALSEGPLHGYAIMQRVEDASGQAMGPGTIYGALRRLTDAGWLEETDAAGGGDARRGRAFSLTGAGREALAVEARRIRRLAGLAEIRRLAAEV